MTSIDATTYKGSHRPDPITEFNQWQAAWDKCRDLDWAHMADRYVYEPMHSAAHREQVAA